MHNLILMNIMLLIIVVMITITKNKYIAAKVVNKKKNGADRKMRELAKQFIDKECIIYNFNNSNVTGFIKEVSDNALLVQTKTSLQVVNLDFVTRISEYPRKKNGKRCSVILD